MLKKVVVNRSSNTMSLNTSWWRAAIQVGLILSPVAVSAQLTPPSSLKSLGPGTFQIILCDIADVLFGIAMTIGIIMIILAAYKYMTGGGNESEIAKAHQMVLYGAIGIAVALIAVGVPNFVTIILTSGGNLGNVCGAPPTPLP